MITLNLIPESIREENRLKHVYRLNVHLAKITVYMTIVITSLVIITRLVLVNAYDNAETELAFITENTRGYNTNIKELNDKIALVSQVANSVRDWDKLIIRVGNLTPKGITLTFMKLNQPTQTIQITGMAETRDDLLKFKDIVNNSGFIENVDIPISSLLEKNNIPFSFSSKLDFKKQEALEKAKNAGK
jgi:hypothetical protein